MSEQESSIKLTAKADIADAIAYARAIDETTAAILRHIDAVKSASAAGVDVGSAHGAAQTTGGANTGSAPAAPAAAGTMASPSGVAPAPPGPGNQIYGPGFGSYPPITGGAATGQAPASPAQQGAPGAGQGAGPAAAPPAPVFNFPSNPGGQLPGFRNPRSSTRSFLQQQQQQSSGGRRGGGGGDDEGDDGWDAWAKKTDRGIARGGMSFLQHATSTAIGVGLGTSLSGFLLAAPQRYLALSESITTVGRKFREADENATRFGGSLGYTIARTAQLADALGRETNTVNRGQFQKIAGFARYSGMDPGAAMRGFGSIERMTGSSMTDPQMVATLATAKSRGMDQGRLEEFMQDLQSSVQQQFHTTGRATMQQALATQGLQSIVYASDDPRRSGDKNLLGGLHSTMTGSDSMKTYMLRAMGYGQKGGPGYIEAKIRGEAGLHDSRNVVDLFQSFQSRGMGTGAQFRALESVSGGNLSAHQINALVTTLGTKEGLDKYREIAGKDGAGSMESFMAMLDPSGKEAFAKGGFGKLGEKFVSEGESIDVRIERMMMSVGKPIAEAIPPLQNAIESIAGTMQSLTGVDWATLIPDMARGIESMAKFAENMAGGKGWGEVQVGGYTALDSKAAIQGRVGKARFLHDNYGMSWWDLRHTLTKGGDESLDALIWQRGQEDRQRSLQEMGPSGGGQ